MGGKIEERQQGPSYVRIKRDDVCVCKSLTGTGFHMWKKNNAAFLLPHTISGAL